jgi:hypothetical protein
MPAYDTDAAELLDAEQRQRSDERRKSILDHIAERKARRESGSLPYWSKVVDKLDFASLGIKWSAYIPHLPTAKQLLALLLHNYREVFYGGAAGGGKSDWLLMEALQWVDVPNYAGIIFRRTLTAAQQKGGIYERFIEWMNEIAERNPSLPMPTRSGNTFWFPSGASLTFAYLDHDNDLEQYQSSEFQFVAFDELTHFPKNRYVYLFSRLRRLKNSVVPIRMRAGSNPGGRGGTWVKERFDIRYDATQGIFRGFNTERPMVPAFTWDNPHLDVDDYVSSLLELDPVTREQLLKGNWNVAANGRIRSKWFRRYSTGRGDHIVFGVQGRGPAVLKREFRCFMTCDPAASQRNTHDETIYVRRAASHTAIHTWLVYNQHLLLWNVKRLQEEIPYVIQAVQSEFRRNQSIGFSPEFISIENNGTNLGVYQSCSQRGLPVWPYNPNAGDKLVRNTEFQDRAEMGHIWLPEHSDTQAGTWLDDFESEVFGWTGHPDEPDDQVDNCSQAGTMFNTRFAPFATSQPGTAAVTYLGGGLKH